MGNKQSTGTLHTNMIADKERKLEDAYHVTKELGTGTSTQIRHGTLKKYTKTERTRGVAIKMYDGKAETPPDLKKEAQILGQLDHPNIVRLFEVLKVGNSRSLVLELCSGGPLLNRLPFKEDRASHIMRQLMSAVSYMHSKRIVHRDIDCSNILFRTPDENSEIKLIDFGSAAELELVPNHPGAYKFLKDKAGTLQIMAPEVIRKRYGPAADVWSCGVVACTMLNEGKNPFAAHSVDEMERKILQGAIDYRGWKFSNLAKEFIQQTTVYNAGLRITAAGALKHPWIEKTVASWKLPNELVMSFGLFRVSPPLKRIALNCLAKKAPPSKYQNLFIELDTSQTGALSKKDFLEGFKHSGNSPEELDDLFEKLDVNMNGVIMFTEFLAATLEAEGELEEAQLQEAFDLISKKSNFITKKHCMKIVGDEQKLFLKVAGSGKGENSAKVKAMVDEIFAQKDKYSYEDFARMFEHGFDANRSMDAIIETSLNEEQLSAMKEDDLARHLATIRENED